MNSCFTGVVKVQEREAEKDKEDPYILWTRHGSTFSAADYGATETLEQVSTLPFAITWPDDDSLALKRSGNKVQFVVLGCG